MKKILAGILLSIATLSVQAAEVKQPMQYNQEATQKLQQKLNTLGSDPDKILADIEFFKTMDQLILQGADPNTYREHDKDNDKNTTATALLFAAPLMLKLLGKNVDYPLVESMIKHALERGGSMDQKGDRGDKVLRAVIAYGSANMVKLAIEYGADMTQKDEDGDTPLMATEKGIQQLKGGLKELKEVAQPQLQKDIGRLEQIRQVLNTAKKMRTAQKAAQYSQEATQKLQVKTDSITNVN